MGYVPAPLPPHPNFASVRCAYCSAVVERSHGAKCKNCGAVLKLDDPKDKPRPKGTSSKGPN